MEQHDQLLEKVYERIVFRTRIDEYLPESLVQQLKSDNTSYNITIISEDSYKYCFSFFDGKQIKTLQFPVVFINKRLDTDALMCFSIICGKERYSTLTTKQISLDIYNQFKDNLLRTLSNNGTTIINS